MLFFDGRRKHDDFARAARLKRKAPLRSTHICYGPELRAKPSGFDPEPRAMRFIGMLSPESALEKHAPRHVSWPSLAQRACEREQDRARRERDHGAFLPHRVAACVHDESP